MTQLSLLTGPDGAAQERADRFVAELRAMLKGRRVVVNAAIVDARGRVTFSGSVDGVSVAVVDRSDSVEALRDLWAQAGGGR